jgi:large subunit ribosomal protein L24
MHVRKDDLVVVITGESKDPTRPRRVMNVYPDRNKIVVEGFNLVYKHLKPSRRNPQGGRLSKEAPIDVSNVMLYCGLCKRGVRVGHAYDEADGHKFRYCKRCKKEGRNNDLGRLSKPRKTYARKAGV